MFSLRTLAAGLALAGTMAVFAAGLVETRDAQACLHPARAFEYPISAGAQKGLIFFSEGREELVIRPSYKIDAEGLKVKNDAVEGFTTVAWVIPLPSLPDSYREADDKLFTELEKFTAAEEDDARNSPREAKLNKVEKDDQKHGAEFLEKVAVGDYTIQPIKAHGELGGMELKGWLKDNGFGEVSDSVLKHYLDNDYYWLAVKLSRAEGLPASGNVKPLAIGFDTETPCYPLKINAGGGKFDLELWVITAKELDLEKSKAFGLQTVEQRDPLMSQQHRSTLFSDLPEVVRKVASEQDKLKKLKAGELHCYRFFGAGMNETTDISKLDKDLNFSFKKKD